MKIAEVQVSGCRCETVRLEPIPRGIVGAVVAVEYTDSAWDSLRKTVVFRGAETKDVLDAGSEVTIPAEVVSKAGGSLYMGVYGVDAENQVVIPSIWTELGVIQGAATPSGDASTEPSLPVWAQIQAMVGDLEALDTEVKSDLVAAVNEALTKVGEIDPEAVQKIVDDYLKTNPSQAGSDGKDGITPTIGENGNWYLGDTDTGKPSRGAAGAKGTDGANGKDGAKGDKGDPGEKGDKGDAFTYADFTAEQLAALKGEKGDKGDPGAKGNPGEKGNPGADGKSAYQYAQDGGYTGTEADFMAKLAQEILSGTTDDLTPAQVYAAVSAGRPVKVQYASSSYGVMSFTAFSTSETMGVIASQNIVFYNNVYILAELGGYIQSGQWFFNSTVLAEKKDIPQSSSGGEVKWHKVADVTTEEELDEYVASTDSEGNPIKSYKPLALALYCSLPADSTQATANGAHYVYPSASSTDASLKASGSFVQWKSAAKCITDVFFGSGAGIIGLGNSTTMLNPVGKEDSVLDGVRIVFPAAGDHFPIGSHIIVSVLGVKP